MNGKKRNAELARFATQQLKMWKKKVEQLNNALPFEEHEREWRHYELRMANSMCRHWAGQVAFNLVYA